MAGYDLPARAIRQQVSSALDMIVHIERMEDGSRRVTAVTEVQRMESDVITLQDLFEFEDRFLRARRDDQRGAPVDRSRSVFLDKFAKRGIELPESSWSIRPPSRRSRISAGEPLRTTSRLAPSPLLATSPRSPASPADPGRFARSSRPEPPSSPTGHTS